MVRIAAKLEEEASNQRIQHARAMLAASNKKKEEDARKRREMLAGEQARLAAFEKKKDMNGYRGLMAEIALREKKEQQQADKVK